MVFALDCAAKAKVAKHVDAKVAARNTALNSMGGVKVRCDGVLLVVPFESEFGAQKRVRLFFFLACLPNIADVRVRVRMRVLAHQT